MRAPDIHGSRSRAIYRDGMQVVNTGMVGRQCSRTGCSDRAEVTLTYDYQRSQVWLDHLSAERDPHGYDMCLRHASRLSVPHGWHLDDRRYGHHALIAV